VSYVTPAQLADSPGAQEIAQCATPENQAIVDTALMYAVLRGVDTSSFAPADVAVAQSVLDTVTALIAQADGMIDGFIGKRYPVPYPNDSPMLTTWARAIVRYQLNKNNISDEKTNPIARDYRDATNLLQLVAAGKFSLGANDPTAGVAAAGQNVQVQAPGRTFDGCSLEGYTRDYQ
jgi:phage gp36-like protein